MRVSGEEKKTVPKKTMQKKCAKKTMPNSLYKKHCIFDIFPFIKNIVFFEIFKNTVFGVFMKIWKMKNFQKKCSKNFQKKNQKQFKKFKKNQNIFKKVSKTFQKFSKKKSKHFSKKLK